MLNADEWRQVRMRGSHRQFQHSSKPGTITVAGNDNIDIPPGTSASILKHAGLR
jgi:predicted RNA binding protein YcfA (HicA-like mRNA interferase family)